MEEPEERARVLERAQKLAKASRASLLSALYSKEEVQAEEKEEEEEEEEEMIVECPEWITGGRMMGYQVEGLNWLVSRYRSGLSCVLADEMGLGKTVQALGLLGYLQHRLGSLGPHLVIAPLSTLANWRREVTRWCPSLSVCILRGNAEERALVKKTEGVHLWITSCEMAREESAFLHSLSWDCVIFDELHRIANTGDEGELVRLLRTLKSRFRLALTGVPLPTALVQLCPTLDFLVPSAFESLDALEDWFKNAMDGDTQKATDRLRLLLRPFMLRRIKSQVVQ